MLTARFLQDVVDVVRESGDIIRRQWEKTHAVRHKGSIDLVTETDVAVEAFLKERLGELLPQAEFLAEESCVAGQEPSPLCWIIDPVDGTTNFAHRFGDTATSVALWENGTAVLGAISAPIRGERYAAERGKGAWLNGRRIHVSGIDRCEQALVATGFPYSVRENMDIVLRDVRTLLDATVGVRRCGAAALDLCFVACGSFDAYFEGWIRPWDVAAGWLLVEEAGGRVTGRNGESYVFDTPILASNGLIHEEMMRILKLDAQGRPLR